MCVGKCYHVVRDFEILFLCCQIVQLNSNTESNSRLFKLMLMMLIGKIINISRGPVDTIVGAIMFLEVACLKVWRSKLCCSGL